MVTSEPEKSLVPSGLPELWYLIEILKHCNTYLNEIRILMIRSFKGKFAEPILQDRMVPKGFPANLAKVARRKLIMVDSADFLDALKSPPGNRLEALKGDLAGKHSIRINDQWRIVFRWTNAGPEDVEIIDYH
jgi:proteic killer suppression protein